VFADTAAAHACLSVCRYALDVNAERAEDVVTHQRLLEEARDPQRRPALAVRVVQVNEHIPAEQISSSCAELVWVYTTMDSCCPNIVSLRAIFSMVF
jgi:hypothetical protein